MAGKRASHLVRSLRALARDAKASPKVRLRACELLMQIDPTTRPNTGSQAAKPAQNVSLRQLLGKDFTPAVPEVLSANDPATRKHSL